MDANDFFMIQHLSEVSQLLKTPDLDQMIRDLLKEEGVKHSPPVRAKTITKDGSRHPKSTPTKLGQSMAVESCSRGAVPDVDKVHCGAKHVTTLDRPSAVEKPFKKPSEISPAPSCTEITAVSNSEGFEFNDRPFAVENPFKKPSPPSETSPAPLYTIITAVSNANGFEFNVSEIESIIQDIVEAKSVAFTVNKEASKLQCQEIAKSMKPSNTMNDVITKGPSQNINPNRKCVLATSIIKYFSKNVAEVVRFAKRIPGFKALPIDDQANLIRGASIECDTISGIVIDPDSMITMSEDGEWFTPEDIATMFSIEFWKDHSQMSRKIDLMKMTNEEVAILKALTVISPDRCILSETSKVLNIQETLLRCLRYQLSKSYKLPAVRLGQLFGLLTSLRSITEAGTKEMKKMFVEFPSMTKGSVAEEVIDD